MATASGCRQALDLFEDELSQRENIVGLEIVPADEESLSARGGMAVAVYVVKKLPSSRLSPRDMAVRSTAVHEARVELRFAHRPSPNN